MNHPQQPVAVHPERKSKEWMKYGVLFSILWGVLTQGNPSSWMIGAFVVPLATWAAIRLFPVVRKNDDLALPRVQFTALFRFVPFFIVQSLKGGWDSALFAILPSRCVRPAFISYATQLPNGSPQVLFINTISLLPGTLGAASRGDDLLIHVLDSQANNLSAVQQCEEEIALLFGIQLQNKSRDLCKEVNQ